MSRPRRARERELLRPVSAPLNPPPKNVLKKSENGFVLPNMLSISSGVIVRKPPPCPAPPVCTFHPPPPGCAPACSYIRQLAPSSSYFLRLAGSPRTS